MVGMENTTQTKPTVYTKLYFGIITICAIAIFAELLVGTSFDTRQTDITVLLLILCGLILYGLPIVSRVLKSKHNSTSLLLSNGALFAVVAFVLPSGSYLLLIWFAPFYISQKLSGRVGAAVSASLFVIASIISVVINTASASDIVSTVLIANFMLLVSMLMTQSSDSKSKAADHSVLTATIEKAQFERQRLIMLINSMGDGVIATDEQGRVKLYNGAALEIIDTNQTLDDRDIREVLVLHDKDKNSVDYIGEVKEANRNIQRRDLKLTFDDNDFKNIFTNITPIKLSFRNNAERGYIMIIRDITKIKSLEEERDEFISVVSHELRTPITIAEGNISNAMLVAEKNNVDEKITKSLNIAHDQVIFLAGMMNDLSMLSRAEHNSIADDLEEVSVTDVGETLLKSYIADAGQKGLKLTVTNNAPDDLSLTSNKLYLLEILQNFITNSIKYTKEGSVDIIINQKPEQDEVEFIVKDTGIGISKSDQQKIFDKFFRSEDFRTRESGGTGLGLFITVKLAKKIKARIDVQSEIDVGSTFSITVPRIIDPNEDDEES